MDLYKKEKNKFIKSIIKNKKKLKLNILEKLAYI